MKTLFEGEKQTIELQLRRRRGTGAITLTTPQRRILKADRTLVTNFDWTNGTATWNSTDEIISALFDSTATGLTAPGLYYLQMRGVIGDDRPQWEVTVRVVEWGP